MSSSSFCFSSAASLDGHLLYNTYVTPNSIRPTPLDHEVFMKLKVSKDRWDDYPNVRRWLRALVVEKVISAIETETKTEKGENQNDSFDIYSHGEREIGKEKEKAKPKDASISPPPPPSSSSPSPPPSAPTPSPSLSQCYRCDFRVGTILRSASHPNDSQCLVFTIDFGPSFPSPLQIVSGMATSCSSPSSLVDTQVVGLLNIEKANIKGVDSFGRLMVATSEDKKMKAFIIPEGKVLEGSQVDVEGIDRSKQKRDGVIAAKNLHKIFKELTTEDDGSFCAMKKKFFTEKGNALRSTVKGGTVQ